MGTWQWIGTVAGGLAALGVIAVTLVKGLRIVRRITHFFDDWFGEPARPGVPERPGVMDRLATTEAKLDGIEHELHPNSGQSLRDQVDEIRRQLENNQGA